MNLFFTLGYMGSMLFGVVMLIFGVMAYNYDNSNFIFPLIIGVFSLFISYYSKVEARRSDLDERSQPSEKGEDKD